ncbi:hypothetical protein [Rhizosaccharibacter radicis]|uniref:Uncharacterized protein n=1 Tax=Rhizosaccharibacter radicis TaxID=2782605 RepID=A0ABT1VXX5_9PROT|nr:hypothetical protein [Acetobacteraceae bacterium KSS12]
MAGVASPGWTASAARTVAIPAPTPLRGIRTVLVPLSWPSKSPADHVDVAIDPTAWLGDAGDTLVGATAIAPKPASDVDLQVLWCTILDGQPVLFVGGGKPGDSVAIQVLVLTASGRRLVQRITLSIDSDTDAMPVIPVPQMVPSLVALTTDAGGVLTLDDGAPLLASPPTAVVVAAGVPSQPVPPNALASPADGSILTADNGLPFIFA